jgi:hypothetical protein
MRNSRMLILLLILFAFPAFLLAQDEEEKYSSYAFQSGVGLLVSDNEGHRGGSVFDVALLKRLGGPLYLTGYAGTGNFQGEGAPQALSGNFNNFWDDNLSDQTVTSWDDLRYRVTFFGGGLTAIINTGKIQPQVFAGYGKYKLSFASSFTYGFTPGFGDEVLMPRLLSLGDEIWVYGYKFGGGLYYHYNQIINFGVQASYHKLIDANSLENLFTFTFGMHIRIP